jgi:acyl CoA:acetate/3-ketoacid CoA transferase
VLKGAAIELRVAPDLKVMDARLFRPEPMGLKLGPRRHHPGASRHPSSSEEGR